MRGKILGLGAISGYDGNRYYYDEGELKNAKEGQNIEGLEVDFEIIDGKAAQVFIINKASFLNNFSSFNASMPDLPNIDTQFVFLNLNEAKAFILAPNIHSVKVFSLLTLICYFLSFIFSSHYFENLAKDASNAGFYIFSILTFFLGLWVNFCLFKLSNDKAPLKYFTINIIIAIIIYVLFDSIIHYFETAIYTSLLGSNISVPYFRIILIFICLSAFFFVSFLWYRKLSALTDEKFFLWSFYTQILSQICLIIYMIVFFKMQDSLFWHDFAIILNILSTVLMVLVWLKFRKLEVKN